MKQITGIVTSREGIYYVVESPEAPAHLRILNLVQSQMAGAKVGDRVVLEYQTTARSGLWNVVNILREYGNEVDYEHYTRGDI